MGPITIFDKSFLQALSMDEAVWFDAFFSANMTPLFYVETLADLEKEVRKDRTPESVVGLLAEKTPDHAYPNVHHGSLISAELRGVGIEMNNRVVIRGGDWMEAPDGTVGVHLDEFPEAEALRRWKEGEFLELERAAAKLWRGELAAYDPDRMIGVVKNILPTGTKIADLAELKLLIDGFCASNDQHVLALALDVLGVPQASKAPIFERWTAAGCPQLDRFAPYLAHVFKVDLLFYVGIHRGFISGERASNKADIAYLYYLPFAMVFTSGDKLHQRTVPLFLKTDQSYVQSDELKAALREIDEHYDRLPEEIKQRGVLAFAHFPPSTLDNVVTQLWDKHMRSDWREVAKHHEAEVGKPLDDAQHRALLEELRTRVAAAQRVTDGDQRLNSDAADYAVVRRLMPTTKGKWRMFPEELEEASNDN
jgi:hypothetical protein